MPRTLTKKQRIFLLKQWWMSGKTVRTVNAAFRNEFPDVPIPTRQTMYQLARKFDETGSIEDASRSGRARTVSTEENSELVLETFRLNPQLTQRRASNELGIARRSLGRIMLDLGLRPYRPRLLQALNEDDPDLPDQILWTDEAIFQINGRVSRHNCVYWSHTNPHIIIEQELNVPKVVVWGGIWSHDVVGPFLF